MIKSLIKRVLLITAILGLSIIEPMAGEKLKGTIKSGTLPNGEPWAYGTIVNNKDYGVFLYPLSVYTSISHKLLIDNVPLLYIQPNSSIEVPIILKGSLGKEKLKFKLPEIHESQKISKGCELEAIVNDIVVPYSKVSSKVKKVANDEVQITIKNKSDIDGTIPMFVTYVGYDKKGKIVAFGSKVEYGGLNAGEEKIIKIKDKNLKKAVKLRTIKDCLGNNDNLDKFIKEYFNKSQ